MRLLLGLLLACPLLAQPSATITVTDALTGQPVPEAKVALSATDFRRYVEATSKMARRPKLLIETDASGVARFEGLLPAIYVVTASRPGYGGSTRLGSQRQITVGSGGEAQLSIALTPSASVSGLLKGEDNEPIAGAFVYAQLEGGNSYYSEALADGRFHMHGLEPGRYRFRVSLRTEQVRASLKPRGDEQWGYPVSFFHPGVEAAAQAEVVQVAAGIDHRVVLRARRELLASVRGAVLDARTRQPLEGAEVELSLDGVGADAGFDRRRVTAKSAAFDFPFVRPGVAWLLVYRGAQSKLPYVVRLDIGRAGWQGAPIRLPAESRIEGRLKPGAIKDANIELRGTRPGAGTVKVAIQADGTFAVDGIPPGPILLSAYLPDHYVHTIHLGGRDVAVNQWSTELVVPEAETIQLELEVSSDTGTVQGRVLDDKDNPVPQAMVAMEPMLPKPPAISDQTGSFRAEKVPPGEYRMRVCAGREERVKVEANVTSTVTLRACDAAP